MIIYNVTVKIDSSIEKAWLEWLNQKHIPEIINTKCFTKAIVMRVLEIDETEGITFAIQYHTTTKEMYDTYISQYAPTFRKKAQERWGEKFVAFRTVLQIVN